MPPRKAEQIVQFLRNEILHWPRPIGVSQGVEHIGFEVCELLAAAKACIDAQRAGKKASGGVVAPRFSSELLPSTVARRAPDPRVGAAHIEASSKSALRWSSAA